MARPVGGGLTMGLAVKSLPWRSGERVDLERTWNCLT